MPKEYTIYLTQHPPSSKKKKIKNKTKQKQKQK